MLHKYVYAYSFVRQELVKQTHRNRQYSYFRTVQERVGLEHECEANAGAHRLEGSLF